MNDYNELAARAAAPKGHPGETTVTDTQPTRRTQDDIDELKRGWRRDPCWDIEDAEGFEAHREELREYRLAQGRATGGQTARACRQPTPRLLA